MNDLRVTVTLAVQSLEGKWVGVIRYEGRDPSKELASASETGASLATMHGMPVRITLDWPYEEDL